MVVVVCLPSAKVSIFYCIIKTANNNNNNSGFIYFIGVLSLILNHIYVPLYNKHTGCTMYHTQYGLVYLSFSSSKTTAPGCGTSSEQAVPRELWMNRSDGNKSIFTLLARNARTVSSPCQTITMSLCEEAVSAAPSRSINTRKKMKGREEAAHD